MAISNIKTLIPGELYKVWDFVVFHIKFPSPIWFDKRYGKSRLVAVFGVFNKLRIADKGDETEIDFTEQVKAKKLWMKPFVKFYLRKQQTQFVADIRKAL